jgi:hypothetical protein
MEGWRQRRLGSNGRNHRRKEQIDLTVTGLLMEGTSSITSGKPFTIKIAIQ